MSFKYNSLAAKNGSFEMCEILINTIKHSLFENNKNLFIKQYLSLILKKNIDKRTPIHEAAKIGNFPMLDFFFRIINNENLTNEYKQNKIALCEDSDDELKTSLHLAAAEGKIKIS
jgi:ankyrin repeat protein